jgi:hypothetical protein
MTPPPSAAAAVIRIRIILTDSSICVGIHRLFVGIEFPRFDLINRFFGLSTSLYSEDQIETGDCSVNLNNLNSSK